MLNNSITCLFVRSRRFIMSCSKTFPWESNNGVEGSVFGCVRELSLRPTSRQPRVDPNKYISFIGGKLVGAWSLSLTWIYWQGTEYMYEYICHSLCAGNSKKSVSLQVLDSGDSSIRNGLCAQRDVDSPQLTWSLTNYCTTRTFGLCTSTNTRWGFMFPVQMH